MELFKLNTRAIILALIVGMFAVSISCSEDQTEEVTVDKENLKQMIDSAQTLLDNTTEGTAEGQYQRGAKDELKNTLENAQVVYDNEDATQSEVDNATVALEKAIEDYLSKEITPIAPDALSGHWTFDEGSGSTAKDYSENGLDGELLEAPDGWNGGKPEWTTDRYGDEGQALYFNEGSRIKVPYNPAINPDQMTIALWVYASEVLENNRFIGLHSWNGYKFQLQSANKAFFTAATTDGIYDKDTDPALETEQWYHLAVTVGDGNMVFYINGTETQKWEDVPGTMKTVSGNDLVFGVDCDKYSSSTDNFDENTEIPLAWGGYLHGKLDEIRFYNTILTESQISSIYDQEKPE
ncbi:MAG: FIVAR domain-containing protein [Bacteroidales bacterium]|nr:FIVAR domain-containing protein [Bacteroidales bacterium]